MGLLDAIRSLGAPPIRTMVDRAAAGGAEVREGFYVSDITNEDGRVTGVAGRGPGGPLTTERARIVVGADGAHSLVAHAVKAPKYNARPSTSGGYYAYESGGPRVTELEIWGVAPQPA